MREGAGITFANVSLSRGGTPVFANLNCELQERRIALIGNNGSGKSSFLRLCNGLLLPDSGDVDVCGLNTRSARAQLPLIAGFLFQNPDHQIIFPTVGEEVGYGLRQRGMSRQQADAAVSHLLQAHGCNDWFARPVHELSDGQKQLVCILSATIGDPKLLLLDEPFASLDIPTRYKLMRKLDALPLQLVMASHDLDLLITFERAIWFENGSVKADGLAREVIKAYRDSFTLPAMAAQ